MKLKTSYFTYNFDFYGFRRMFYLVSPRETMAPTFEETFNYVDEAGIWFFIFIIFEFVYDHFASKDKKLCIMSDTITSLTAGLVQVTVKSTLRYYDLKVWIWIYQNYRLVELAWDSTFAWFIALIGVDFLFYWQHRALHEVHFLWALHQMHHNSEYFNFSTALRQGLLHQYVAALFYMPLAFFIPPQIIFVHSALNLVYQFLIHTQVVPKLGFLERVLNTPSHHRVHHATNVYCIDKNYGGLFIIWDKMFGTFQAETSSETLQYGLAGGYRINTFDSMFAQLFYFKILFGKVWTISGFFNKLKVLFYGPDWLKSYSKPNDANKSANVPNEETGQLTGKASTTLQLYILAQYVIAVQVYTNLLIYGKELKFIECLPFLCYMFLTAFCFGQFLDGKQQASRCELFRSIYCYVWVLTCDVIPICSLHLFHIYFISSILMWTLITMRNHGQKE